MKFLWACLIEGKFLTGTKLVVIGGSKEYKSSLASENETMTLATGDLSNEFVLV